MDYRKYNTLRIDFYKNVINLLNDSDLEVLRRLFDRIWKKGSYYCNNFNNKTIIEAGANIIYNDLKDAGIITQIGEDCYTISQGYVELIVDKLGLLENK